LSIKEEAYFYLIFPLLFGGGYAIKLKSAEG